MHSNIEQIKSNIRKLYLSDVSEDVLCILFELAQELRDLQEEVKSLNNVVDRLEYNQRSNT